MIPFGIMAVTCTIAGALCFKLPETRGRPTPEDFDDDDDQKQLQHTHDCRERNAVVNKELQVGKSQENQANEEMLDMYLHNMFEL